MEKFKISSQSASDIICAYAASYEVSAASEATLFWVWEKVIAGGENGGGENHNELGLGNVPKKL